MRPVREITAKEESFRTERVCGLPGVIRRDPVKPEPEGTIILVPFRITGYDPDCDGSLMARLEAIDKDGEATGWETNCHGLYPSTDLVVTPEELKALFGANVQGDGRRDSAPPSQPTSSPFHPPSCSMPKLDAEKELQNLQIKLVS